MPLCQGRSQDFTWGAQKLSAEGARIKAPSGWGLGSRQRIFGIFEAHRTLLVKRTVPTKPVFFR